MVAILSKALAVLSRVAFPGAGGPICQRVSLPPRIWLAKEFNKQRCYYRDKRSYIASFARSKVFATAVSLSSVPYTSMLFVTSLSISEHRPNPKNSVCPPARPFCPPIILPYSKSRPKHRKYRTRKNSENFWQAQAIELEAP